MESHSSQFLPPPLFQQFQTKEEVKRAIEEKRLTPAIYTEWTETLYNQTHEAHNATVLNRLRQSNQNSTLLVYNLNGGGFLKNGNADKVFQIFQTTGADILCLSETLVPNHIAERSMKHPGKVVELSDNHADDDNNECVFQQPYGSNVWPEFAENKLSKNNGVAKTTTNCPWETTLYRLGFRYLLFSNPNPCPWGSNWGNVILTKTKPVRATMWNLPTTMDKPGRHSTYNEARTVIGVEMEQVGYVFMTHLENNNQASRVQQAKGVVECIKEFAATKNDKTSITVVGDFNSLHASSYTEKELAILLAAWYPPRETIPHEAVDTVTEFLGTAPLNAGQTFESKFQKCVTHGWSTGYYTEALMYFTDAMDFDHQPLLLTRNDGDG